MGLQTTGIGWIEVRSTHFRLFSNAGERRTTRIVTDLEQLRSVLEQVTNLKLTASTPTLVYVFEDDRAFTPYKNLYQGEPAMVDGFYRSTPHASYIAVNAKAGYESGVIFHEYIHSVSSSNFRGIPLWFEEGLAELYETFTVTRKGVHIGKPIERHLALLQHRNLIPLPALFAVDRASPIYNQETTKGGFYAQSWALVHYLFFGNPERLDELQRYLEIVAGGADHGPAFAASFGGDPATLERELQVYLSRRVLPFLKLDMKVESSFDISVEPMDQAEALYRLGELLANEETPRREAIDYVHTCLALDPDHGPALVALARAATENRRFKESDELYQRALQASPDDPVVLYWVAEHLMATRSDLDAAVRALRLSTALTPDFGPAWSSLALALRESGVHDDDTIQITERAAQLMPANRVIGHQLVRLYVLSGRREQALDFINRAYSATPGNLSRAHRVLLQADIEHLHELLLRGDTAEAEESLKTVTPDFEGISTSENLYAQYLQLRIALKDLRLASRYREAEEAFNRGEKDEARNLLEELILQADGRPITLAARRLIQQIDNPGAISFEGNLIAIPVISHESMERLNVLLGSQRLEEALEFLRELRREESSADSEWVNEKISEVQKTIRANAFVVEYNRAVGLYNSKDYAKAIQILEDLSTQPLPSTDLDDVKTLLKKAKATRSR